MKCKSDNPNNNSCRTSTCVKIGLMAIAGIALLGWIVMLLWNWLLPALFIGARPVDYCQALGILVLSKILFGGFRGFGRRCRRDGHQSHGNMSPEEREQMKAHFKSRWGHWCCTDKPSEKSENIAGQPAADDKK
jgi:hypothetical protein